MSPHHCNTVLTFIIRAVYFNLCQLLTMCNFFTMRNLCYSRVSAIRTLPTIRTIYKGMCNILSNIGRSLVFFFFYLIVFLCPKVHCCLVIYGHQLYCHLYKLNEMISYEWVCMYLLPGILPKTNFLQTR